MAHNLEHLGQLLKPEVAIGPGETLHVPLLIHNGSSGPEEVTLTVELPQGWTEHTGTARYPVREHDTYPVQARLVARIQHSPEWQEITWKAEGQGQAIGSITLRVYLAFRELPQ